MRRTILRDAERTDLDALAAIEEATFASDRLSRRSISRLVAAPTAIARIALSGNGIAGYSLVLTRAGSGVARLYSLAVHPGHRRRGFAAALLADAEREARSRGRGALRLEVRADNPPAIRLYEGRGYRLIGRYPGYYADGVDALRFEKSLEAGSSAEDRSRAGFAAKHALRRDFASPRAYITAANRRDAGPGTTRALTSRAMNIDARSAKASQATDPATRPAAHG